MKRYSEYKDSDIQWIGKIPNHWKASKLRCYLKLVSVKGHGDKSLLSVTRELGVIRRNVESKEENHNYIPEDLNGYKLVKKGQFVINKMKSWQGSYGVSGLDGIVSPAYYVCELNSRCKDFFSIALRSMSYIPFFSQYSKGIRVGQWDLSVIGLKSIPYFEPTLAEQQAIVDYLKVKTSKIEQYVTDRERERELLESLKQSEIANVVTRGLNPNVPMKDSGIPWIGMIPRHWNIMRAKNMFRKEKRDVRPEDEVITCFRDGQVTLRKNRRTTGFTESFTEYGYQGIRKGDLVIHQMDAFAGSIGVSDSDGKGTSVYHCCTPKGKFDTRYYAFLIRIMAHSGFIQSLYRGIRERSSDFKFPVFGNQKLIVPPLDEQQAIVDYIETRLAKIDTYIANLQAEIDYLKEFKQRLISDVVTGQICVAEPQKGEMR